MSPDAPEQAASGERRALMGGSPPRMGKTQSFATDYGGTSSPHSVAGTDDEEGPLPQMPTPLTKQLLQRKLPAPAKQQPLAGAAAGATIPVPRGSQRAPEGEEHEGERTTKSNFNQTMDIAEMKPTLPVLAIMLSVFFVLYVSQVFVFQILGSHGIPFKGGGALHTQPWGLMPELPNYFAMALVGFLPCKKNLWELSRRQILSAICLATIDLVAQCMSKTGLAMMDKEITLYIILNSAFCIIFTAVGAKLALGKRLNWGQYLGIAIVIVGVIISAHAGRPVPVTDVEGYQAHFAAMAASDAGFPAAQQAGEERSRKIHAELAREKAQAAAGGGQPAEAGEWLSLKSFGILLVVLSTLADGMGFVTNEKLMNQGVNTVPGTLLCCIIGLWNSSILVLWQFFYTLPRWDAIIQRPLDYLYNFPDAPRLADGSLCTEFPTPVHTYGKGDVIFKCVLYIFVSGFFCRVATMYLLKHVGAVTFVVIKMMKIGAVAALSVGLGKESFEQTRALAACVITVGVGVYSWAKIRVILAEKTELSCVRPHVAARSRSRSENLPGRGSDHRRSRSRSSGAVLLQGADAPCRARGESTVVEEGMLRQAAAIRRQSGNVVVAPTAAAVAGKLGMGETPLRDLETGGGGGEGTPDLRSTR